MRNKLAQPAGSVVVYALLLMLLVAASGFTLSALLFNELRASQNLDESLKSYYAAESGIEQSLDFAIAARNDKTNSLSDTLGTLVAYHGTLPNSAEYTIDPAKTTSSQAELIFALPIDQSQQLDLFSADDSLTSLDVDSLVLDWQQACVESGVNSQIEVTLEQWLETTWLSADSGATILTNIYTCGSETPVADYDCKATEVSPASGYNYRVRIKSLNCDLPKMRAYLLDSAGKTINIPNRVIIASQGRFGRTSQTIFADLPWRVPLTGLADFVLFSEADITK